VGGANVPVLAVARSGVASLDRISVALLPSSIH